MFTTTKVQDLKVGQMFDIPPVNPFGNHPKGIVSTITKVDPFVIITTTDGGWYRIFRNHVVNVSETEVIL